MTPDVDQVERVERELRDAGRTRLHGLTLQELVEGVRRFGATVILDADRQEVRVGA